MNLLDDFLFGSLVTYPEVGERFVRKVLRIIYMLRNMIRSRF